MRIFFRTGQKRSRNPSVPRQTGIFSRTRLFNVFFARKGPNVPFVHAQVTERGESSTFFHLKSWKSQQSLAIFAERFLDYKYAFRVPVYATPRVHSPPQCATSLTRSGTAKPVLHVIVDITSRGSVFPWWTASPE